ncbi:uncharacterized protein LOC110980449 [Acanthaster planci]|uniref:Uncharacterized protein LOC110980449 n=1 Tax=Acanthaster planci TaxID=133434 RepID=A0A8B7YJM6_ACAPL|nr:uncharacterized protein LOC110980449 [Acanthaster planci]
MADATARMQLKGRGERFPPDGMEREDTSRTDTGCFSTSSSDLETDSRPTSDTCALAKGMGEKLKITSTPEVSSESTKEGEEMKKEVGTLTCSKQELESTDAAKASISPINEDHEGQQDMASTAPTVGQDVRLHVGSDDPTDTSDHIACTGTSETAASHQAQVYQEPGLGDDNLAKADIADGQAEQTHLMTGTHPPVSNDVREVTTAAQPDFYPVTCPNSASAYQSPSPQTAREMATTPHTPTQETILPKAEEPPPVSEDADTWEKEHFDVLLLHSEHDVSYVNQFQTYAQRNSWKTTSPEDFPANMSKFAAFNTAFKRSTFTVLFLTKSFLSDFWCENHYQTALVQSIENPEKRFCVIPVICDKNAKVPMELGILTAVNMGAANCEKILKRTISVEKRMQREKAASRTVTPLIPTATNIRAALATEVDAAACSLDELYRRMQPTLNPGQFASSVFPKDGLFRQLCVCLDRQLLHGKDWRLLAENLGFKKSIIEDLQQRCKSSGTSPMVHVLECFCQQQLAQGKASKDILDILHKHLQAMPREDAIEILRKM